MTSKETYDLVVKSLPDMSAGRRRKWKWKLRLWDFQFGRCYWCHEEMLLELRTEGGGPLPDRFATIEHLDSRKSGRRGTYGDKNIRRRVLACYRCNNDRGSMDEIHFAKQMEGANA